MASPWCRLGAPGGARQAGRSWPPRPRACEHAPTRTGTDEAAGWHGPAQCWACQVGCQVGCGQVNGPGKNLSLSLLFIVSVFYYSSVFRALFKILK